MTCRPSDLFSSADIRCSPDFGGATHLVVGGGRELMTGGLALASGTGVRGVFACAVCPAISGGRVCNGRGSRSRADCGGSEEFCVHGCQLQFEGGNVIGSSIGTVIPGRAGGGGEVTVSSSKVALEVGHGLVSKRAVAPITAGQFKDPSGKESLIARVHDHDVTDGAASSNGKGSSSVKLVKENVDGCRWVPRSVHAHNVGCKVRCADDTMFSPEMSEHVKGGDTSKTDAGILERHKVFIRAGSNELEFQSVVGGVVGTKNVAVVNELAIRFCNKGGSRAFGASPG